jgi:hypothetical protein
MTTLTRLEEPWVCVLCLTRTGGSGLDWEPETN